MPTTQFPRGLSADLALADQTDFDTPVTSGFKSTPFYTSALAQTEGLPDDDLLGGARANDRDQRDAAPDLAMHGGALDVPLCLNNVGHWLKGGFGAPVTTVIKATGSWLFSAQPAVGSTLNVNGTVFTFVASGAAGNQINIGANLAATITAIATVLNASVIAGVAAATYGEALGTTITISYDTAGPAGNVYTLSASATSNATASGATLTGGCYNHVFTSGIEQLPSRTIGIRKRVPSVGSPIWFRNVGCIVSALRVRIAKEPGYRRVGVDLVGKLEEKVDPAVFGSIAAALALDQVPAAIGQITVDAVAIAALKSMDATWTNGVEETGLVTGQKYPSGYALDSRASFGGSIGVRYLNEAFYDWGTDRSAKALSILWSNGPGRSLQFDAPAVQLSRVGIPITGPAGIEASINFRGKQTASVAQLTTTLKSIAASY